MSGNAVNWTHFTTSNVHLVRWLHVHVLLHNIIMVGEVQDGEVWAVDGDGVK